MAAVLGRPVLCTSVQAGAWGRCAGSLWLRMCRQWAACRCGLIVSFVVSSYSACGWLRAYALLRACCKQQRMHVGVPHLFLVRLYSAARCVSCVTLAPAHTRFLWLSCLECTCICLQKLCTPRSRLASWLGSELCRVEAVCTSHMISMCSRDQAVGQPVQWRLVFRFVASVHSSCGWPKLQAGHGKAASAWVLRVTSFQVLEGDEAAQGRLKPTWHRPLVRAAEWCPLNGLWNDGFWKFGKAV